MSEYHEPVMVKESLEGLNIAAVPNGIWVDVTFGGGGHTKAILAHTKTAKVVAVDQDWDTTTNTIDNERLVRVNGNFRYLKKLLRLKGITKVNGILADLGVSWHQFNTPNRGFSIRFDEAVLDMRMNQEQQLTAREVLSQYSPKQLEQVLKQYGELTNAPKIAKALVTARKMKPLEKVGQLKTVVEPYIYGKRQQFFARVFQALRIEVNGELEALKALLEQTSDLLHTGGRVVVISYHSLEDRLVKNYFKRGSFDGVEQVDFLSGKSLKSLKPVNKKVILPTSTEIKQNPKSRSAKLRVAERL